LVDPGDAAPVFAAAAEQGLRPEAVLITHHHHDHIGGLRDLLQRWPSLAIYAPEDERIPLATERVGAAPQQRVALSWRDCRFDVLQVPGHTRSHIAFVGHFDGAASGPVPFEGAPLLFCGDTLFSLGCGRVSEGTHAQMLASLDRLAALPDATRVCCTHEYTLANGAFASVVDGDNPALSERIAQARSLRASNHPTVPSTMAQERATNPFLRCDSSAIRASVASHLGQPPADRVETYTALRRWKDTFRA
jgi:hydroxyacylglutathione hydrolase